MAEYDAVRAVWMEVSELYWICQEVRDMEFNRLIAKDQEENCNAD